MGRIVRMEGSLGQHREDEVAMTTVVRPRSRCDQLDGKAGVTVCFGKGAADRGVRGKQN